MKVGVYYKNSDVRVEERPQPAVGDRDILVKVMACGLCGSDLLEWYRIKRAPLVLGHEPAGIVVETGKLVRSVKPGDRVFVTHHVPCNACYHCLTGHETACTTFQNVNNFEPGGFSQFLRVTGRSVDTGTFVLPDSVSFEQATFIEPLATAVRALRTVGLKPAQSVLVCGSGIAGLLIVKLARAMGAGPVIATDVSPYRLEKARQYGARHTIAAGEDVPAFIKRINEGRLADTVILCAGALPAARTALMSAERGGTILFFAVPKPGETLNVDFNPFWRDDITIKTCYGAAPVDNMQALDLIKQGTVDVSDMVTHRFGIDRIGEAFMTGAMTDSCLKIIVEPNQ
ncbi:MAG TPA: alcohol dehydrogenase catalytic domain-containing protein [Nitrospirota bacterium]|nr:alcohol dehydrogenase catalytic domain-containing protein [Nitrospirota bacterium]